MTGASRSSVASTIGYLFADIERSTERWERAPQEMRAAVVRQGALVDALVVAHQGVVHDRAGDGVFAIFEAGNPLHCALEIQLAMQRADWSAVGGLSLRLGIHVGRRGASRDIDQPSVNRAARIMASGWGGQIVVSGEAIKAYAHPPGASFVDLGVCHFQGIDEPLQLSGLIHPGMERREFPPLRSHLVQTVEIPQAAGFFVGREREIEEISALLTKRRLVTLVGPGGIGKTRLAAHLAAAQSLVRPVAFVSLDSAANEDDVVAAIAAELRFPFHGAKPREEQLIDYLRTRPTFFVLDNGDAVAGKAGVVDRLIRAGAAVLATSREPLQVADECHYRLEGLRFADEAETFGSASSAFELFAFEAKAQGAEFSREAGALETFQSICRLLDGSPLALRLVARWSRFLGLSDILAQLQADASFLSADDGGGVGSLKGVFDGSWRLLNDDQRRALMRLSVFAGPFDWSAARYVADVDLATYAALADKSLLEEDRQRRFYIHPLIRFYAREKLKLAGDDERLSLRRYSDHYLDKVRAAGEIMTASDRGAAFDELARELHNVRAAYNHAQTICSDRIRKTIPALHEFLMQSSRLREAVDLFSAESSDHQVRVLQDGVRACCYGQSGEFEMTERTALTVFKARGDKLARAYARHALGSASHARGEYQRAQRHYKRALALWIESRNHLSVAYPPTSLAALHLIHGDRTSAADWIRQAFRLSRQSGNGLCMAMLQMLAGDLALKEGRNDAAKGNYEKALASEATDRTPHLRSSVLRRLGSLARLMDDPQTALRRHQDALELAIDVGERRAQAHALIDVGDDLFALGRLEEARRPLIEGCRLALSAGVEPVLLKGAIALARTDIVRGARDDAARIVMALDGRPLGDLTEAHRALCEDLGDDALAQERPSLELLLEDIVDEAEIGGLGYPRSAGLGPV